jgi:hypothetical protein
MRRRVAAIAVVGALGVAGCGSSPLSSGELQNQASRVCALASQQANRIRTPASPAETSLFLRQGIAALTPALVQLRKLRPPSDVADVYSASVKAYAEKLGFLRAAQHDIAAGQDPIAAMQTLQEQLAPIVSQENGGWQALNIPACINH